MRRLKDFEVKKRIKKQTVGLRLTLNAFVVRGD